MTIGDLLWLGGSSVLACAGLAMVIKAVVDIIDELLG